MAKEQEKQPVESPLQDEFAGQGGSYTYDPKTGKRTKNLEESENGKEL